MRRHYVLGLCMAVSLACDLVSASSFAQQKSLKEQLVGAWTLVSASSKLPDGTPTWGANPIGLIIFTNSGHYSTQLMRSDLPKYASNNRATGTPDEYKAVAIGSVANFGTYTVNEANKTFTIRYDGSTFPNRKGAEETRPVVIEGVELRITNPAPSTGGPSSQLVYRRAK
jgi:lipocalin-like protein